MSSSARAVLKVVRELMRDPHPAVWVSLAEGRVMVSIVEPKIAMPTVQVDRTMLEPAGEGALLDTLAQLIDPRP